MSVPSRPGPVPVPVLPLLPVLPPPAAPQGGPGGFRENAKNLELPTVFCLHFCHVLFNVKLGSGEKST